MIDRIAVAMTINVKTPMVDRDATDVTDTTTNQHAETTMVEATVGSDVTATTAV